MLLMQKQGTKYIVILSVLGRLPVWQSIGKLRAIDWKIENQLYQTYQVIARFEQLLCDLHHFVPWLYLKVFFHPHLLALGLHHVSVEPEKKVKRERKEKKEE